MLHRLFVVVFLVTLSACAAPRDTSSNPPSDVDDVGDVDDQNDDDSGRDDDDVGPGDGDDDVEPADDDEGDDDVVQSPSIEWCNVQFPTQRVTVTGVASELVFGRVRVPGVTDGAGGGAGVRAQVGFGSGTPPDGSWTWSTATYNPSSEEGETDEYMGAPTAAASGSYAMALRFSVDEGATWCVGKLAGGDYATLEVKSGVVGDATIQGDSTVQGVAGSRSTSSMAVSS